MRSVQRTIALAIALLISSGAWAGVALSPAGIVHNTLGIMNAAIGTDNAIDGSGLSGYVSGTTDFDTFVAGNPQHDAFHSSNAWASAFRHTTGVIDFDLGGTQLVSGFALFSVGADGRTMGTEINSFTVFGSGTSDFSNAVEIGTFNGQQTSGAQVFSIEEANAQFVRVQINSNYGSQFITNLGEIIFNVQPNLASSDADEPVPAPLPVVLLALGLIGLGLRRV